MTKILCFIICLILSAVALAQTAEEILDKMDEVFSRYENDGIAMTVQSKIPILGSITMKACTLGQKSRMETKLMGPNLIIWDDGETEWTYNAKNNELAIDSSTPSSGEDGDAEMFKGVADGYDVSIKKETADAWYILCKKSKTNTIKEAPKNMEIVVAKGTYHPVSLTTKIQGVTLIMKDLSFGLTEEQVTFDPKKYASAKVVDKRK